MITMVEERWRTFSFWVWQGLQQHFEAQAMRDEHGVLRKVDFPFSHSNILKSAESIMWTALTKYDKNEGRRREAKPVYPNELNRFTTRTPMLQAIVWGIKTAMCNHNLGNKFWNFKMSKEVFAFFMAVVKNVNIKRKCNKKEKLTQDKLICFNIPMVNWCAPINAHVCHWSLLIPIKPS